MLEINEDFSPLTEFGHHIQQCVMTLIVISDGQIIPLGTGFTISADGLMMTASHILKEATKHVKTTTRSDGSIEHHIEFYALYLTNKSHGENDELKVGGLLPILRIWHAPELDIGYCWLNSPITEEGPLRYPVLRLSPGLPEVGESILGFGYRNMKGAISMQSEEKTVVEYYQATAFTKGKIIEVFPLKRDGAMLPFPCFHTNARFDHGMSGGPIFNSKGYACGVICSSMPSEDESSVHTSYGSLIWPALLTPIDIAIEKNVEPTKIIIYDLIQKGFILADETLEKVIVGPSNNGMRSISLSR